MEKDKYRIKRKTGSLCYYYQVQKKCKFFPFIWINKSSFFNLDNAISWCNNIDNERETIEEKKMRTESNIVWKNF